MAADWNTWLAEAMSVLGIADGDSHVRDDVDEDRFDRLIAVGNTLAADEHVLSDDDLVRAARVLAVLRVRRAALGVEIADLSRRRAAARRAQNGTTGYLNAPDGVPIT